MKFAFNSLVAAAAIAMSSQASAAIVSMDVGDVVSFGGQPLMLHSGSGSLAYSTGSEFNGTDPNTLGGLIGALNVGNVKVYPRGGVGIDEAVIPDEFGDPVRVGVSATAQITGLKVDGSTGQILSVSSTGGADHVGSRISGTLTGGIATVTNLRFDLANNLVYADLTGTKNAVGTNPAINYNLPDTALWTFDSITGPTTLPLGMLNLTGQARLDAFAAAGFTYELFNGYEVFQANNVISGLRVTPQGFDFFKNSLGLLSTGVGALTAVNDDPQGWGTVTSTLAFAVPVPEPGTYAMLAAGLLVVGGALNARRRRQQP